MKITVSVVRIYGTDDTWGEAPRLTPSNTPITFANFPRRRERVAVFFGSVPPDVIEAERTRRALWRVLLLRLVDEGRSGEIAAVVDEILADMGDHPSFKEHGWYVTLVHSREIKIPDESVIDSDIVFFKDAYRQEEDLARYARDALDLAAAVTATIVDPNAFSFLVHDDKVLLHAEGKRSSGIPRIEVGLGAVSVGRGAESVERLGKRLDVLAAVDPNRFAGSSWIARFAHWRLQALAESDPWKRFLWGCFALEILTHKLYDQYRPALAARLGLVDEGGVTLLPDALPTDSLLWDSERAPLKARFAVVAASLLGTSAKEDVEAFGEVLKARGELAHGAIREANQLPQHRLDSLLVRYSDAALKAELGRDPASPWES